MSEKTFFRFQPDAMKRETLEKIFVGQVRERLIEKMAKEIVQSIEEKKQRHYLIVGSRGVGKTHFITLLYFKLKDAKINASLVKLSEEEFSIYRVSDLLQRIIEVVGPKKRINTDFQNLSDEGVISTSLDELKKSGKSVVLFIENLNQILNEQMNKKEVKRLRSLLQKENLFTTIATTPTISEQISDHNEPFFNFFEIFYLAELDNEELIELLNQVAEVEGNQAFAKQLSLVGHKIKAITTLTGGNPRIAILLYDLTSRDKILDVEKAFFKILDDSTPYYQDIFRMMTGEQRRIFDALIAIRKPSSPSEISKMTRLNQNTVNSQLRRLEKEGYLVSRRFGRITKYEVRERLFRLWRELRKEPFGQKKLSILLEFLELWYSSEERERMLLKCLECSDRSKGLEAITEAGYWFSTLPDPRKLKLLPSLIEASYKFDATDALNTFMIDDKMRIMASIEQFKLLVNAEKFNDVLNLFEKTPELEDIAPTLKGMIFAALGRYTEALEAANKALEKEPNNDRAWTLKGDMLDALGKENQALEAANKALEKEPNNDRAWTLKGNIFGSLGRYTEALEAANKALEINQKNVEAGATKAQALKFLNKPNEGLKIIEDCLKLDQQNDDLWIIKTDLLGELERYDEALKAADNAIKINPNKLQPLTQSGQLLILLNRQEDALKRLERAAELYPNNTQTLNFMGEALFHLGRNEQAIEKLTRSIEIDPNNAASWARKAKVLESISLNQEALECLSHAIQLRPYDSTLWFSKALILAKLESSEAEEAYNRVIELTDREISINPRNLQAFQNKANALLAKQLLKEASDVVFKLAEIIDNSENKKCCISYGNLLLLKINFSRSIEELKKDNRGNAEQNLNEASHLLDNIDTSAEIKHAKQELTTFLNKVVDFKSIEYLRQSLSSLKHSKNYYEFLNPFEVALTVADSKDISKFYEVQVEKREIIAKIVENLMGSSDLLPLEYKSTKK
jgi:uncharacterized protein